MLILFYMALLTLPIYANPIVIYIPIFEPLVYFFLFGEALVIALILRDYKFYFIKTLLSWQIITTITFLLFSTILTLLFIYLQLIAVLFIIPLEYIVIKEEAKIIQNLSKRAFLNREPKELSYKKAFKVSLIGNLVSIYMSLIALIKQFI